MNALLEVARRVYDLVVPAIIGLAPALWLPVLALVVRQVFLILLYRPAKTLRLMEVAAFSYFVILVTWVAWTRTYSIAERLGLDDATRGLGAFGLAMAYFMSLARLYLLEWYVESTASVKAVLAEAGRVLRTGNYFLRAFIWFLLLSFPVYLGGHEIPWPRIFGRLGGVHPLSVLLLLHGTHLLWTVLFLFRASVVSLEDQGIRWFWAALWSSTVSLGAICLYAAEEVLKWPALNPILLAVAYCLSGVLLLLILWADVKQGGYISLAFVAAERREGRGPRWLHRMKRRLGVNVQENGV